MITKAFTKFSITTDIRKLLIENVELKSIVNNNIFPILAPEGTTADFIIYYRDKYGKEYANFGIFNEHCTVWIAAVSDNYDRSQTIAELINEAVEGKHNNTSGYEYECRLIDSTEDFEDKKYIQILVFEIK